MYDILARAGAIAAAKRMDMPAMAVESHPDAAVFQTLRRTGDVIDLIGMPRYFSAAEIASAPWTEFGFTAAGWYAFFKLTAPRGVTPGDGMTVTLPSGSAWVNGSGWLYVGIPISSVQLAQTVSVNWDGNAAYTVCIRALDLALYAVDLRTTHFVVDLSPYIAWTYALTTDTAIQAARTYYTRAGSGTSEDPYVYTAVAAPVLADIATYYIHSAGTVNGIGPNINYRHACIDAPLTLVLPALSSPDNASQWIYIEYIMKVSAYSITISKPAGISVTAVSVAPALGINTLTGIYIGVGTIWRLTGGSFTAV